MRPGGLAAELYADQAPEADLLERPEHARNVHVPLAEGQVLVHAPAHVFDGDRPRGAGELADRLRRLPLAGDETVPGVEGELEAWRWLAEGVASVVEEAAGRGVVAAFEPEPGMLVETLADYERLASEVPGLELALDTGHCLVTGEKDPEDAVRGYAASLGTVAVEDMRRGVHEHLPFGRGDMDVPAVLAALEEVGFSGLVCVELSRESHRAHRAIPESIAYLKEAERRARNRRAEA